MKRVYSTDSVPMAWHIRNSLQQHDIEAEVRNANLYSVAGEIPLTECQVEVWVQGLYFQRAERLVREFEQEASAENWEEGPVWECANCGEENLHNFIQCWNCQSLCESENPVSEIDT